MKNLKNNIVAICLIMIASSMMAQVGIGTSDPDSSSMLEISSANKGLLPPRVASVSVISNPAEGLVVYDLLNKCFRFFNGSTWSNCLDGKEISNYTITSCLSSSGSFRVNNNLTLSNFITLNVTVTSPGPYDIFTDTVNGYDFRGSGTFSGVETTVIIYGNTSTSPNNPSQDFFNASWDGDTPGSITTCPIFVSPEN